MTAAETMPTLFRYSTILAVFAALVFGAMLALATFVTPRQAEVSVPVPLDGQAKSP